jgi:hypothetical protein
VLYKDKGSREARKETVFREK